MPDPMPILTLLPELLTTQLLAATVYAEFFRVSSDAERVLWKKMLDDEVDHISHIRAALDVRVPASPSLPEVNVARMRQVCKQVAAAGKTQFLLRLEGALRLECAELDYGLEGMAARQLRSIDLIPHYTGDIREHINYLLREAERYATSPNIGLQMKRLQELFETCIRGRTTRRITGVSRKTQ